MKSNHIIKFLTANLSAMLLLLFVLISNYSLVGLIIYLVGSGLLFLGTFADSKNVRYGVANKIGYYFFIAVLVTIGIQIPRMLPRFGFFGHGDPPVWMIVLGIAGFIAFVIVSGNVKGYVLKTAFSYVASLFGFFVLFSVFSLPFQVFPLIAVVNVLYALFQIYATKNIIYNGTEGATKRTAHFFMAIAINLGITAMILFFKPVSVPLLRFENFPKLIGSITDGIYLPLFAVVMVINAALCMFAERKSNVNSSADAYLAISMAGAAVSARVLTVNMSLPGAIIFALSLFAYFIVSISLISYSPSSDNSNPIYWMLGKGRFAAIVYSAVITGLTVVSVLFLQRGNIVSYLILVCGAVLSLTVKRICGGLAIAEAIRWQVILATVFAFTLSISIFNQTIGKTCFILSAVFAVFSIVMWGLGLRDGVNAPKKYRAYKLIGCVLAAVISVIAVIPF